MPILATFVTPHPPLIVPEVGRGKEREIKATIGAFGEVAARIAALKPKVIIFITPHSVMYQDYIHISPGTGAEGDFAKFGAPGARYALEYDNVFRERLTELISKEGISAGALGERDNKLDHGTMIPLHFINKEYADYKALRISISGLGLDMHYRLGKCIAEASADVGTVIVASGDLSHKLTADGPYGFAKEGPEFDAELVRILKTGDLSALFGIDSHLAEKAAECGYRSVIMMAGALDGLKFTPEVLSYEGPFGVGYCVAAFTVTGQNMETEPYVYLAKRTLEGYIKTGKIPPLPDGLPDEMLKNRAGVFVSIKKHGDLRGCIGTIAPTRPNIAEEIVSNAISSGTRDSRFAAVTERELTDLTYSVDVLMPAEPADSIGELDVYKYGVIVTSGFKRGLLLPNLEGVDTAEEQVRIALAKAGIRQNEPYRMERFQVVRHK